MIPTLHIEKLAPGEYQGQIIIDDGERLADSVEPSISAIIARAALGWKPAPEAMHIWYEHVSIGTVLTQKMRDWPELLAQDLVDLHGKISP